MIIKRKLILFFQVITSFFALIKMSDSKFYSSFSVLLILLLFLFYYHFYYSKEINLDFKIKVKIFIFSFTVSFIEILGSLVYKYQFDKNVNILSLFFKISNLIKIVGLFFLISTIILNIIPKILNYDIYSDERRLSSKKMFIISFFIIFCFWIPYFLVLYPGVLSGDSIDQLTSVYDGFKIISDHHPVLHTIIIGFLYKIGYLIFHNSMKAVAFYSLCQMAIMSGIFSYFIVFLNKNKVKKSIIYIIISYFALSPIHAYYSVTMWKDIIFAGLVLIFIIQLIKNDSLVRFKFSDIVKFSFISLFVLLFRNNAIYMYIFIIPFLLFRYKKNFLKMLTCIVLTLLLYFIIKGPIFSYFNISKSESYEYVAIPLQQVGRMAYKNVTFSENEINDINQLINIDDLARLYNPMIVDSIKFSGLYNIDVFDHNKIKYFKLWLNLVLKHPNIAIEAYLNSTLGYWYPDVEYWATTYSVFENNIGITANPHGGKLLYRFVHKIDSRNLPILSLQWSIGLCIIIISFTFMLSSILHKRQLFYYLPIFGIWLTLMVASPVFAEFRYIYSAFTCLPLFILLPFLKLGGNNEE